MNMNQKGFANITLIVVVVTILAGMVVYFGFTKESKPHTQQQTSQKVDETQDWITFTNEKYNYSFKHPQDISVGGSQYATDPEDGFSVHLSSLKTHFNVEAQDPSLFSTSIDGPAIIKTMELPLKEFAQEIWKLNEEDTNPNTKNKEVGQISQTLVDGKTAYQFTLTSSYNDERGGHVLDGKYNYVFVENNGLNFMISLHVDDPTAGQILKSFKFIN